MIEKEKNKILWKPALEVFSGISTWIAVPIILAVIGGKALDKKYNTGSWFILSFAAVSFLISSYGIVSTVKKYAAKIKENSEQDHNLNDKNGEDKK